MIQLAISIFLAGAVGAILGVLITPGQGLKPKKIVAGLLLATVFAIGAAALQLLGTPVSPQAITIVVTYPPAPTPVIVTASSRSENTALVITSPPREVVKLVEVTSTPNVAVSPAEVKRQQLPTETNCASFSSVFSRAWSKVQTKIGCEISDEISGQIVVEEFENGKMLWRQPLDFGDASNGYAIVLSNSHLWKRYSHSPYKGDGGVSCNEALPMNKPTGGFGMMWCDIAEIRQLLGNAVSGEKNFTNGTAMQEFTNGFMVLVEGTIYIFYADGSWESRLL